MATRDVVMPEGRHALYDLHRYSPAVRSDGRGWLASGSRSR